MPYVLVQRIVSEQCLALRTIIYLLLTDFSCNGRVVTELVKSVLNAFRAID